MIAGLPGTGIGGMYYLIVSLWMPIHGLFHKVKKDLSPFKKGIIKRQVFLTLMVIGGMWVTGWLMGICLAVIFPVSPATGAGSDTFTTARNVVQITPLILTLVTLTLVYLMMVGILAIARWRRKNGITKISSLVQMECN
jgi:hypothetical protein